MQGRTVSFASLKSLFAVPFKFQYLQTHVSIRAQYYPQWEPVSKLERRLRGHGETASWVHVDLWSIVTDYVVGCIHIVQHED